MWMLSTCIATPTQQKAGTDIEAASTRTSLSVAGLGASCRSRKNINGITINVPPRISAHHQLRHGLSSTLVSARKTTARIHRRVNQNGTNMEKDGFRDPP
jgi:hypothetical protein